MVTDKIGQPLMYLVRHATVDLDVEGKIRGTQNEPLNDQGEDEALELAEFFRDLPVSAVYSDDLDRSYHTAISIAHAKDLEVVQDIALRSWDVGHDLEGLMISAHESEIKELKLQPNKIPVGGQSWNTFESETLKAFDKYLAKAMDASAPIVLVVHGSGLQVIWDYIGAADKSAGYDSTPIEPSGVAAICMARDGYKTQILRKAKVMEDA
jgi:probable phosphoglycerate mutase